MRVLPLLLLVLTSAVLAADCTPDAETAVRLLNAARAQPQSCGAAAPPLRWEALLDAVARRHAQALAGRDRLDHVGDGGTTLRTRLREAGYLMRVSGENLAGGPESLEEALALWLASPGHCENLMAADFEEFGLACVDGPGRLQRYWVLQMAAPAGRRASRSSPDR